MRALGVVVLDVDAEHPFEVTAVQDQQPVETLGPHGSDEALGNRVRFRSPHRRLQDPNLLAAEYLVEATAVRAVAVADQEADLLSGEGEPRLRAC